MKEGKDSESVKDEMGSVKDKWEGIRESEKEKEKEIQDVDRLVCQGHWSMIRADSTCVWVNHEVSLCLCGNVWVRVWVGL